MTQRQWMDYGTRLLRRSGVDSPETDAWYLFSFCFHVSREDYLFFMDRKVEEGQMTKHYEMLLHQRGRMRIPLQYLTGTQDFMGRTYHVTKDVLIPRLDTEEAVDGLIREAAKLPRCNRVLDLCTGSGCIAITLACELQPKECIGSDLSTAALKIAKENGRALAPMVKFIQSDLLEGISGTFDLIVSNPPYIPTKEYMDLMPEVRDYEPRMALDAGDDGLCFYRKIIAKAPGYLNDGGLLAFEIGCDQDQEIVQLMRDGGLSSVFIKKDLTGRSRLAGGWWNKGEEHV